MLNHYKKKKQSCQAKQANGEYLDFIYPFCHCEKQ